MKTKVLIVHSSADLYGSDKSLLSFVSNAHELDCVVALPERGPLFDALQSLGVRVELAEVLKVQRKDLGPMGAFRLLGSAWRSWRDLRRLGGAHGFDVVYSNTVAVFGGALYAKLARVPHVWHVREILARSRLLGSAYRSAIHRLSTHVVCNSSQTLEWIRGRSGVDPKYCVIWNGVDPALNDPRRRKAERDALGIADADVVFVLVGRVNSWKGQHLAIDAFESAMSKGMAGARLLFVGSAYRGNEHFEEQLSMRIAHSPYREAIHWVHFRADIDAIWDAADVALVPSTEPEPFGRVAIEAMSMGRPVIAAGHGGLLDIVEDKVSGLLVAPGNSDSLAAAMQLMHGDASLRTAMGRAGRIRQSELFSVSSYSSSLEAKLIEAATR